MGYVYALDNPCFRTSATADLRESLYPIKIGMTYKDPYARAAELYTTGLPAPFEVIWYYELDEAYEAEQYIHKALALQRLANNREFFWMNPRTLAMTLKGLIHDFYNRKDWGSPFDDL